MNPIIEEIVRNAHKLYERQDVEPITKTNPFLYNVSHLCITNRELMGQIPAQEAGYLAFAYMHILDLTDDPSVFQIYSTISFYFTEKALQYGYVNDTVFSQIHVQTLNDALIIMNIGARSLCRTFAQAQSIEPSNYINFDNLYSLPSYVKQILLCEYSYFIEFEKALATVGITLNRDPQMYQRFNMLKKFVSTGFFEEFGADSSLYNKAKELRRLVYSYAASKIEKGDIFFRLVSDMKVQEFDDSYYVEGNDYDDTIIKDDPAADAFGTPDMYRRDPTRRYSEDELEKMSVRECYDERQKCSKEKNDLGQRDIFTYDFKKYGIAASPLSLFAISYLYGKTGAEDELMALLRMNSYILFNVNEDIIELSQLFLLFGMKFPNLDNAEVNRLEELYNDTRYCGLIDELLFDKELLPRKIKGITREDLERRNDTFPDRLLDDVYQAFERNSNQYDDDEDTVWQIYDRRNNCIISKPYKEKGAGEIIADGAIDAFVFFNLIEEKYEKEYLDFFVQKIKDQIYKSYDIELSEFRGYEDTWIDFKHLMDFAKMITKDENGLLEIKRLIALAFLLKCNSNPQK